MNYAHIIAEVLRHPWAILDTIYESIVAVLARCEAGERLTEDQIRAAVGHEKMRAAGPWVVDEDGRVFRERVVEHMDGFEIVSAYDMASKGGAKGKLISVIPIHGVIANRVANLDMSEGGTGIDLLTKQFRSALNNPDVKAITLDVDSPGGSVYGVDELAAEIFAARGQKKVVAQVNPMAASAAYYLASQASEIAMTPSGEAGSIGVRTMHQDLSKALEMKGVKLTHISAGKFKTEGSFTEPLNDEARAAMQARVNDYYDMFVKAVARGRDVKTSDVRNGFGEGRMLGASDAKKQGMVDRIATLDETLSRLGAAADSSRVSMSVSTGVEQTASAEITQEATMATPVVTPTAAAAAESTTAIAANNKRISAIMSLAAMHKMHDKVAGWVAEDRSLESVQAEILTSIGQAARPIEPTPGPQVTLTDREQTQYSILRGVRNLCARAGKGFGADSGNCFEFEISDTIAKKLSRDTGGFFMPTNIRTNSTPRFSDVARQRYEAVLGGATSPGSNLVQTTVMASEFIELLRNMQVLTRLGVRKLGDLQGNLALPKQTGAATLQWVGENPGSAVTPSDQNFTQVPMSPKTAMAQTVYSRQFVIQSSLDAEQLVREDLAAIFALGLDAAGLTGTGASNQPTGISATAGINLIAIGTNGGALTYNLIIDCQTALENNNIPLVSPGLCTTPALKGKMRKTAKLANTIAGAIWDDDNMVAGYPGISSNQLPANLTKGTGTNLSMLIAGDFAQAVFGEWGAMEIIADPYTQAGKNNIVLTSNMLVDFAVRYPAAFSIIKDADPLQ